MSCVARKWATAGTTTVRPVNTALAKEMNDRLKEIQEARNTMDASWSKEETAIIISETVSKIAVPIFDRTKTRGF